MPTLLCPVRRCGGVLTRGDRVVACSAGHSFDVARSGYLNLLQPQDRRSRHPGDSADTAGARRRVSDAGHEQWIVAEVLAELDALGLDALEADPAYGQHRRRGPSSPKTVNKPRSTRR